MERTVRCQAVIIKNDRILVLRQYNHKRSEEYWMLPGGGLETNESEEECIKREIKEETNLDIDIKMKLFDDSGLGNDVYKRYVTFLCTPITSSSQRVGSENDSYREILELVWISFTEEKEWNEYIITDQFYPSMSEIKKKLLEILVI